MIRERRLVGRNQENPGKQISWPNGATKERTERMYTKPKDRTPKHANIKEQINTRGKKEREIQQP
jgi:hypothetical protein